LTGETGFRFPFGEQIHLPDDLPAIDTLEQVELLPFTEQVSGRDGPHLKGHLQLTAVYAAEGGDDAVRTFTRQIPLDISLPTRAETQAGDIRLEVAHFDVELTSGRSLSVTGTLALSGLAPGVEEETRAAPGDGEIVAVHRAKKKESKKEAKKEASDEVQVVAGDVPAGGIALPAAGKPELVEAPEEAVPAGAQPHPDAAGSSADDAEWPYGPPAAANPDDHGHPDPNDWPDDDIDYRASAAAVADAPGATPAEEEAPALRTENAEALPLEPKVAFKPLEELQEDDVPAAEAVPKAGKANNELEWRKLFLSGSGEEPLRKLRLCIVQKEETIDTIAERYRLNPREIALYNRLSDSGVTEGQILYIPLT
jgi:stage VI sporulation protein D